MFFKKRRSDASKPLIAQRPSKAHHQWLQNDQLPFLVRSRFSALPQLHAIGDKEEKLSLLVAVIYIIDLFGIYPFILLPSVLVQIGIFAIPLVLFIVTLQIYTSYLLSQCWLMAEKLEPSILQKHRYPYSAVAELAYGRTFSIIVVILLDVSIFSQYIPNLMYAAKYLDLVVDQVSNNEYEFSYCYWVIMVGICVCPLMWLGSPKHMRWLILFSVFVVALCVILLWLCLFTVRPTENAFQGINLELPSWVNIIGTYSLLTFQFDVHSVIMTLQIDMQNKSQVSWAAFSGITTTGTIAIIGSVIAAHKFGNTIKDDILKDLPKSVPLFILLVLVAIQLCFSSVVGSNVLFLQVEHQLKVPSTFSYQRVLVRSTLIAFEVILAEFVPNFEALMDIVGGTITGPLVFIIPPLIFRRISHMKRIHERVNAEATYGTTSLDLNQYPAGSSHSLLSAAPKMESKFQLIYKQVVLIFHQMFDFSFPTAVFVFGCIATIASAYLGLFNLQELFKNNSICFGNITSS